LLLFGSVLPNNAGAVAGADGAASNELRPVTEWSSEVGEQVKATLTENMQMIQQMQTNLSARRLDANIDLMKSLYQRLRWAVQATDTFAPKQMQPLPLQLNTTLIRNALAGVAQTPLVPSGVDKSQMDALRAKASAQLDRLQQKKQQPQAAATTSQPKARAAAQPRKRAAAGGAGGAARRRKKRPEYEESDEEDEFDDGDDEDD
jgi:hypothetical protein